MNRVPFFWICGLGTCLLLALGPRRDPAGMGDMFLIGLLGGTVLVTFVLYPMVLRNLRLRIEKLEAAARERP
jgi:hypothetical protein